MRGFEQTDVAMACCRRKFTSARWTMLALLLTLTCVGSAWGQAAQRKDKDPITQIPTVQNPRRIAQGPHGQVLVTDRRYGAIIGVDKDSLQAIWSYPLPLEGAPFGLATWNNRVFVGNTKTMNVEVYRLTGSAGGNMKVTFLFNLGHTPPGQTGFIKNPTAIAVDAKTRRVFVLDSADKKITVFDLKGAFVSSFYPVGTGRALLSPVSIAVDETRQEVLVSDYGDPRGSSRAAKPARILIYDYEGELLFQINGDRSTHWSTVFARVQGIATSPDGRIFAADPLRGQILVLDRTNGALLAELGTSGDQPGELMLPLDVLLDEKTGDLFISNNRGARRLEVLRGAGRQP